MLAMEDVVALYRVSAALEPSQGAHTFAMPTVSVRTCWKVFCTAVSLLLSRRGYFTELLTTAMAQILHDIISVKVWERSLDGSLRRARTSAVECIKMELWADIEDLNKPRLWVGSTTLIIGGHHSDFGEA
jgi:hypothetical protein